MTEINDFKVAILLLGNIRTWEDCKESFQKTFGVLNADVFVDTYNLRYGYHSYINDLFKFDEEDEILTNKQIKTMFKDINVVELNIDNAEKVQEWMNTERSKLNSLFQNMDNCFSQCRKLDKAMSTITDYEYNHNIKYDIVIKTRCDMIYNPVNFSQILNKVIIDSGNIYPNDCIIMSDRDAMEELARSMLSEFYHPVLGTDTHEVHPHRLLQRAVEKLELEFDAQKIMAYVLRRNNIPQPY